MSNADEGPRDGTTVAALEDVTYAYRGEPVIDGVSLTVESGELLGLLGPNGSGKSTLVELLVGLVEPDSGTATLLGAPATERTDGRVGYVEQGVASERRGVPVTVRELVRSGRQVATGFARLDADDAAAIDRALGRVEIQALADRRLDRLSGGQRQRAYIARALAAEADLLVLDEPTVGVDATTRERFYELLASCAEEGMAVVLVEHDVGAVTRHATTVACLNRELHFHGEPATLCTCDALERTYGADHRHLAHEHP